MIAHPNDDGANGAPAAPTPPKRGSVLRVTIPLEIWKQAERFAQARTLCSLEELLAAFVGDLVRAQARPDSWEAERVGGWINRRYLPVEWLRRLRAALAREHDHAGHAGRGGKGGA